MAKKLLMLTVAGKPAGMLTVDASADDLTALKTLFEGKVEQYDSKASGGTYAAMPAHMRRHKFSCGKRGDNLRCSFTIPHLKATKEFSDVSTAVVGAFDANFDVATKADYCNLLLANSAA